MLFTPSFPTLLHQQVAGIVKNYFLPISNVDTILIVNSCASGQAVPESDLDLAILTKPSTPEQEIKNMETAWHIHASEHPVILKFKQSTPFCHIHLDVISGNYAPAIAEPGGALDLYEIEIGNHICYSAPMEVTGSYFEELQEKWLPYYNDSLRMQRLKMVKENCIYNLEHIPLFVKRGLHFQAFDVLWKAFQEYLQALFISNRIYPIAYNKWIREQITKWLNKPGLYSKLSPILSVSNIESKEINHKSWMLMTLLNDLP